MKYEITEGGVAGHEVGDVVEIDGSTVPRWLRNKGRVMTERLAVTNPAKGAVQESAQERQALLESPTLVERRETLVTLGTEADEAAELIDEVRRRDGERFEMQLTGGIYAGTGLLKGNAPTPTPLSQPRKPGQVMNPVSPVPAPETGATER